MNPERAAIASRGRLASLAGQLTPQACEAKDSSVLAPVRLGGPRVSHGSGLYVWDQDGNKYIDGSGGPAGVFCLGHAHPEVTEAAKKQMDQIAFGYTKYFSSDAAADLTKLIGEQAGGGLNNCVFCTGGSEAVESCLKIALQYQVCKGFKGRSRFISRERSYHGDSLGAAAISGMHERRGIFEPALKEVSRLSPVNAYRPPIGVKVEDLAEHCAKELEAEILRLGPETVCAFIFEPVVGSAGGAVPSPPGYGERVREICSKHGVLLIADEVLCGVGRTGTWRASEQDNFVPDIMAIAKGLAGGVIPLAGAIYTDHVHEVIAEKHGGVATGHTFTAHTAACAAGLAVQTVVKRDGLLAKIRDDLGPYLHKRLQESIGHLPYVGDIRGRGLLAGIELVADRKSKAPFDRHLDLATRVTQACFQRKMLCYPMGGNDVPGVEGGGYSDHVLLAPAFIATHAEVDQIVDALALALGDVMVAADVKQAMSAAAPAAAAASSSA